MTEQEKQELKNELRKDIVNELKAGSTSVQELEEVQALDNVESLPAARGGEMVKVPINLLGKPAADAAALALEAKKQADDAAINADAASKNAATNAKKAQDAATYAATAITEITTAKEAALQVVERYEDVALKAYKGATARFDGMLEDVEIAQLSANEVAAVYYVISKRIFVGKFAGQYVSNWSGADFYMSEDRTTIRKDKLFLLDSTLYAWNEKKTNLEEIKDNGSITLETVSNIIKKSLANENDGGSLGQSAEKYTGNAGAWCWGTKFDKEMIVDCIKLPQEYNGFGKIMIVDSETLAVKEVHDIRLTGASTNVRERNIALPVNHYLGIYYPNLRYKSANAQGKNYFNILACEVGNSFRSSGYYQIDAEVKLLYIFEKYATIEAFSSLESNIKKIDKRLIKVDYHPNGYDVDEQLPQGGFTANYIWSNWQLLGKDVKLHRIVINEVNRTAQTISLPIATKIGIFENKEGKYILTKLFDVLLDFTKSNIAEIADYNIVVPAGAYAGVMNVSLGERMMYGYTENGSIKSLYCEYLKIGFEVDLQKCLRFDYSIIYGEESYLADAVKYNSRKIDEIGAHAKAETNYADATDVTFLGSSLTAQSGPTKSFGWINRLNDFTDVVVENYALGGTSLERDMNRVVSSTPYTFGGGTIPEVKPMYMWWGNSANGTGTVNGGAYDPKVLNQRLLNALKISQSLGAIMLLGSEEDYDGRAKYLEANFKAFSREFNVPYSPIIQMSKKLYPRQEQAYKGFILNNHFGYRANAVYHMHLNLLNSLPIVKNCKLFKIRPTYKNGNPFIGDLNYDTIDERARYWYAASPGGYNAFTTGQCDNLDNVAYAVPNGQNEGIDSNETCVFKKGGEVTCDKFALIEFILEVARVSKFSFEVMSSEKPTGVYVAFTKNAKQTYNDVPRSVFKSVDYVYTNNMVAVKVQSENLDLQLYDKVRIVIQCAGKFNIARARCYDYDGVDKVINDILPKYHYRLYGKEMNDKTSCETGWELSGSAAVKSFPVEIANYTDYNNVKSHIALVEDLDSVVKIVRLSESCQRVAVRVVCQTFPKIATTRTFNSMTSDERQEYISDDGPSIKNYDYIYGGITCLFNEMLIRRSIVLNGWQEIYYEVDVDPTDTSLKIQIDKTSFVDDSYINTSFPILIHDVSVQKVV